MALVCTSIAPKVAPQPPASLLLSRQDGGKEEGQDAGDSWSASLLKSFQRALLSRKGFQKATPTYISGTKMAAFEQEGCKGGWEV